MREVTISPKTAFRLIQWLSQDNDADARALVNLLSREALGDIKAEEKLGVHDHTDGITRQKIANALGMPWGTNVRTDDIVKFINDNCTKGAMQTIKELRRDVEDGTKNQKYLRDCLQEIGRALGQTNLTPACVTESALVYIKEKESTEHPDTYKVNSIRAALSMSGHKYQDVTRRIRDIVDQDIQTGPVRSLHQFDAEAKLAKVEALITDPTKLYHGYNSNETHTAIWGLACQIMYILKGKHAATQCADTDPNAYTAQKAADEASDPLRMAEAKISELEAKLAIAQRTAERGADDNVKLTKLRAIIDGVHSYDSQIAWLEALRKAAE